MVTGRKKKMLTTDTNKPPKHATATNSAPPAVMAQKHNATRIEVRKPHCETLKCLLIAENLPRCSARAIMPSLSINAGTKKQRYNK